MTSLETPRSLQRSFRQLIDNLELELRFGSQEGLESAINELLSRVKMDTFEVGARVTDESGTNIETVAFSSNPEAVYRKLLTFDKETTGARLEVTCGHCGQRDGARSRSSWGREGKSHIKFLIDNFPKEL